MNCYKFFTVISLASAFFCSCQSTRVYLRTQEQLFEDNSLVEERMTIFRLDYKDESQESFQKQKLVEDVTKHYYDLSDDYAITANTNLRMVMHLFTAESEKSSKSEYTTLTFSLIEAEIIKATNDTNLTLLGQKQMRLKNGMVAKWQDGKASNGDAFSAEDDELFKTVSEKFVNFIVSANESDDSDGTPSALKMESKSYSERIKVVSTPNGRYIAYSALGKPFVILGSAVWNVIKCVGYAFINFSGGYNLVSGKHNENAPVWMLPSYKKSRQKAAEAKEANKIQHYPEYHLPFTDNHIEVDKYDRTIGVEALLSEDAEKIAVVEHHEYDNTISVSLSSKADAASVAASAGLVGTAVTLPVSVATWVGGAAFGIYGKTQN